MEKTGCKIICGAPTTLAVKGLTMMMMMMMMIRVTVLTDQKASEQSSLTKNGRV